MQRAAMRGKALQAANSITNMSYGSACYTYTYGGCPVPQLSKVILGGEVPAGNCSQLAVTS